LRRIAPELRRIARTFSVESFENVIEPSPAFLVISLRAVGG
jgi:hypothetical protein